MPTVFKRPLPDRTLYEVDSLRAARFVVYSLALFIGGGVAAWLVATGPLPAWLAVPLTALLVVIASHGAHMAGFVGHEGIHLLLHRNKYVSLAVGIVVSAMTGFSAVGYGVAHWNHHRFTNRSGDPDATVYPTLHGFWARALFARGAGTRGHVRATLALARGEAMHGDGLPFTPAEHRMLARWNIAASTFWVTIYAVVGWWNPSLLLFAVVLPILVTVPVSGLRGYVEHGDCDPLPGRDSRSFAAPFYTRIFMGNNLHLEHHLYPGIPCYNLPAVHRLLRDGGWFEQWDARVDTSLLGPWITAAVADYPNPAPDVAAGSAVPAA